MSWDGFPMYLHCTRFLLFFLELLFFCLTQTGISCLRSLHVMGWVSYVFALYTFVTLFERCICFIFFFYSVQLYILVYVRYMSLDVFLCICIVYIHNVF